MDNFIFKEMNTEKTARKSGKKSGKMKTEKCITKLWEQEDQYLVLMVLLEILSEEQLDKVNELEKSISTTILIYSMHSNVRMGSNHLRKWNLSKAMLMILEELILELMVSDSQNCLSKKLLILQKLNWVLLEMKYRSWTNLTKKFHLWIQISLRTTHIKLWTQGMKMEFKLRLMLINSNLMILRIHWETMEINNHKTDRIKFNLKWIKITH